MNSNLTHFKLPGDRVPSLIDLTAEGFRKNEADAGPSAGVFALVQILVGALLLLGLALVGIRG